MEKMIPVDVSKLSRKVVRDCIVHRYGLTGGYRTISSVCVLFHAASSFAVPGYSDVLWFFYLGDRVLLVCMKDVYSYRFGELLPEICDEEGNWYRINRIEDNLTVWCGFDIYVTPLVEKVQNFVSPRLLS